jgi:hypothetical protein
MSARMCREINMPGECSQFRVINEGVSDLSDLSSMYLPPLSRASSSATSSSSSHSRACTKSNSVLHPNTQRHNRCICMRLGCDSSASSFAYIHIRKAQTRTLILCALLASSSSCVKKSMRLTARNLISTLPRAHACRRVWFTQPHLVRTNSICLYTRYTTK